MTSFDAPPRHDVKWEMIGDEVLVLDARNDRVHRLSGDVARAATWALTTSDATIDDAPIDLRDTVVALLDAGVIPHGIVGDTRPRISRRRAITLGAVGVGIVSLALPSAAAAASTEGGGGGGSDPAPPPVGEISATSEATSLALTWEPQTGVDFYRVFYRPEISAQTSPRFVDTTTNSVTISALTPLASYAIWIISYRAGRASLPSSTIVRSTTAPPAPDGGSASSTSTSITFSWTGVAGADGYRVEYWPTGHIDMRSTLSPTPATATSVTASGLTSGTAYSWYVQASIGGVWSTAPLPQDALTASTQLTSTTVSLTPGPTSLGVTWASVTNATSYQVLYKRSTAAEYTSWGATASNSSTITGLVPNTSYDVYVVASNSFSTAPASVVATATTTAPPAPGQPTVSATTYQSITLAWNAVADASTYEVFYRTGADAYTSAGSTASTTLTITRLVPSAAYDCYVTATISGQTSAGSTVRTATTAALAAPAAPTFSQVTATSIRVTWSAVDGATGYRVHIASGGDAATVAGTTVAPTVTLDIADLVPSTSYSVFVVATRAGTTSADGTSATASTAAPTAPTAPSVSSTFTTSTVQWAAVTGADSYEVSYRTGAADYAVAGSTSGTSLSITDLLPNTSYDYQVRTIIRDVRSAASTTTTATTGSLGTPTPGAVTIDCTWSAVDGATGYEVWARTGTDSFTKRTTDPLTATSFTISGLTVETAYDIYVIATKASGNETSNTRTSTTLPIASGGTRADGGSHWIHTITASGNFVANLAVSVDYLLVGGGGGAGRGGGGGGGVVTGTGVSLSAGTYPIAVGAGGLSGSSAAATTSAQRNGGSTTFNGATAGGGGGGGKTTAGAAGTATNGSGGGAGATAKGDGLAGGTGSGTGGTGGSTNTWTQGSGNGRGGGGGGAGGAGTNSSGSAASTTGGSGGGTVASSITGTSRTYAGGGRGGGTTNGSSGAGTAGYGDGGDGSADGLGAAGRAGVVIIKYSKTPSAVSRPMVIRHS